MANGYPGRKLEVKQSPDSQLGKGDLLASPDTARLQSWNRRLVPVLADKSLQPISSTIKLRTEFSGAGTAEESMHASASLWNQHFSSNERDHVKVICESVGDWCRSARHACSLNHPESCLFGDIMGLAPPKLKAKLEEHIWEKARSVIIHRCCSHQHWLKLNPGWKGSDDDATATRSVEADCKPIKKGDHKGS